MVLRWKMVKHNSLQMSFFDFNEESNITKLTDEKTYNLNSIVIPDEVLIRLSKYNLDDYVFDIETKGLKETWDYICQYVINNHSNLPALLDAKNFGELYEIGLATQDKMLKKKSGQYYTPDDVAEVMSVWLQRSEGTAVCDVACGTGKLILTYLELIGYEESRKLISSGNLYLYDFDNVALKICRTTIAIEYGLDIADSINDIFCDFLDPNITLPDDCKVIANPPYAHLDTLQEYWNHTDVLLDTKEFYSAFMEKIFTQAKSTVIITPFSFISGNKFYSLRKKMSELGFGLIVSFDNVPGNIFCGRKHGVFNTNTANSVRAAITVLYQSDTRKGFKVSPLIRFKNEERKELLNVEVLEKTLPDKYQIVDRKKKKFEKIEKDLYDVFQEWVKKSKYTVKDLLTKETTEHFIDMPNTCRYYTTASGRKLSRTGSITMSLRNKREFNFLYCMINSSFAYWWWRVYDGGITYPVSLLNSMPLPLNLLIEEDDEFFEQMAQILMNNEENYIITKMNAGSVQENIKFPEEYREAINERLLSVLGFDLDGSVFNKVHANCFF